MVKPKTWDNVLDSDEINLLVKNCITNKEKIAFLGLLYTGMRVSELIHLNKSWINFEKEFIKIPSEMECNCYECRGIWKPKTKTSVRHIPLVPEIAIIFKEYFKNHYYTREILKDRINTWATIKKVSKGLGIKKKLFPHALRGTFASILDSKKFSESEIMSIMGWKSTLMFRTYINSTPNRVMEAYRIKW